jgi:hypothetical protein
MREHSLNVSQDETAMENGRTAKRTRPPLLGAFPDDALVAAFADDSKQTMNSGQHPGNSLSWRQPEVK